MIDSTHITDPYIFCLENTLTKEQCNKIIDKFNVDSNVAQGVTADGIDLNVKNSQDLPISDYVKDWKEEDTLFFNVINNSVEKYYAHLNSKHNLKFFTTGETYVMAISNEDCDWTMNFGSPLFSISSGNSDGNGHGNFEYTVPTGFYTLNSKNLAEFG